MNPDQWIGKCQRIFGLKRRIAQRRAWRRQQRAINELRRLSAHQLDDLGVPREAISLLLRERCQGGQGHE